MYKIKVFEKGGRKYYIPQYHIFLGFWGNVNCDDRVTGSIFYDEDMSTDCIHNACYSERDARAAIESYKKYYRCISPIKIKHDDIVVN